MIIIIGKKKITCYLVDFAVSVDDWVKIKKSEKIDKYLDLARELKKLWNMKYDGGDNNCNLVCLERRLDELEIKGRIKTVGITTLLRSARIFWEVLGTCLSNFCEKSTVETDVKNLNKKKILIIWTLLESWKNWDQEDDCDTNCS